MEVSSMDNSLLLQMQMLSQGVSTSQNSQLSSQETTSELDIDLNASEEVVAASIEALASGTIDGNVPIEIYA